MKKNEENQSRREFLKKVAKKVLPIRVVVPLAQEVVTILALRVKELV